MSHPRQDASRRLVRYGQSAILGGVALSLALAVAGPASAEPDIAHGSAVSDGTYPWAVSLHLGSDPTTANLNCSGSHIAPEWVLTAAHCFDSNLDGTITASENSANEYWFSLNRTRISNRTRGEVIQGSSVILNGTNDIALVRLARPSTAPIVALATSLPATGSAVTTAGWGFTDNVGTIPDNLQRGAFRTTVNTNALDLKYLNLGSEEMCGGDSGGPVFTESGGVIRLVAVHTNSPNGCGVNTGEATGSRVDVALPWIRQNVPAAYGFVWASQPSTASYVAPSSYSHNSTGASNTITRSSVGVYTVTMPGLGQPNGNVQVTAYGSSANRCKVTSWTTLGTALRIAVRCHTAGGFAADTPFVAQYYRAGAGNPFQQAYLWANMPTAPSYTPSPLYSFNSRGGTNTVVRNSTGVYTANLPGFTTVGGNVAVTAYGSDSNVCKVSSWGISSVIVRCFTASGLPADSLFSLRYTDQHVANNFQRGAYVWANDSLSASYTPSATYRFHSLAGTITAGRTNVGTYTIRIPNMAAFNRTSAMVTAYGASNTNCKIQSWLSNGVGGVNANVLCFTPAGALTNSQFTLSYLTNI